METKLYIVVKADMNDGDYIEECSEISREELDKIRPLLAAINDFRPYQVGRCTHHHNFCTGEALRDDLGEKTPEELYPDYLDELEIFSEYVPHGEYGIHTIKSVKVLEVINEEKFI